MPFYPPAGSGGGGLGAPLVSASLGSPAASLSASGIPATSGGVSLRNLLIVWGKLQGANAANTIGCGITFNGDATIGNYGQSAGPGTFGGGFGAAGFQLGAIPAQTINVYSGGWMWIFNYVDAQRPAVVFCTTGRIGLAGTAADFAAPMGAGQYQGVGPITRVDLVAGAGNFLAGAYLEVFGVG